MKQCLIHDVYIEALAGMPLPPELKATQAQINHLVRRGLEYYGWSDPAQEAAHGVNGRPGEPNTPEIETGPNGHP